MAIKMGTVIALILMIGGLFFLWAVFFRLPLEAKEEEAAEEMQYLTNDELNMEQPEDLEGRAASSPVANTGANAADVSAGPATANTGSADDRKKN